MKNRYNDNHFFEKYSADTQETKIDKIKTTNINVLLNRVKLNKKKEIRKIILLSIATILSILLLGISIF